MGYDKAMNKFYDAVVQVAIVLDKVTVYPLILRLSSQ